MVINNKIFLWKPKTRAFWQKTRHFGKFAAFNRKHSFRTHFHDYLLSLYIWYTCDAVCWC